MGFAARRRLSKACSIDPTTRFAIFSASRLIFLFLLSSHEIERFTILSESENHRSQPQQTDQTAVAGVELFGMLEHCRWTVSVIKLSSIHAIRSEAIDCWRLTSDHDFLLSSMKTKKKKFKRAKLFATREVASEMLATARYEKHWKQLKWSIKFIAFSRNLSREMQESGWDSSESKIERELRFSRLSSMSVSVERSAADG